VESATLEWLRRLEDAAPSRSSSALLLFPAKRCYLFVVDLLSVSPFSRHCGYGSRFASLEISLDFRVISTYESILEKGIFSIKSSGRTFKR
jgi:hypothetical protein